MALTIYGSPRSRTMRTLWMAEECGLSYTHIPYAYEDPVLKEPAFLTLNPAGAIPTIDDDGVVVAELLAINLYLAKKYRAQGHDPLYPREPAGEARTWQWTLWAQAHLEPWVQQDRLLEELRTAIAAPARPVVAQSLAVLERTLQQRGWLVGEHFSVADLNVAGVLSPSRARTLDLRPFPAVADWLARCYARPAAVAVRQRFANWAG